jgi:hypothetical protein
MIRAKPIKELIVEETKYIPPEVMCKCGHIRKDHFKTTPLGCMKPKCDCKLFKDVKVWEQEKRHLRKRSYKTICDEIT